MHYKDSKDNNENKQNYNNTKQPNSHNNKNGKKFKYKHAQVNKVRPKLTKGNYSNKSYKGSRNKNFRGRQADSVKKDSSARLRIIPIGGLDTIGKNMTAFECGDDVILVDAGSMFPGDNHPGIDLILPDYTYILQQSSKIKAIIVTHGHEDHIGCLPYLLKDLDRSIPIYATKLSIGFIKAKFEEHGIKNNPFHEINSGDTCNIGSMQSSFFTVNHSIPGAVGLFLQTPAGNILHTGDFKLDQTPIDGELTDFSLISKFSKIGIDVMMSDSTNANQSAFTPSESVVGPEIEKIIASSTGKVIIASFSSHIHRIQQVCDAAEKCGRNVVVTGRSMVQNTEIARKLGYLHVSDDNIIDAYEVKSIPSDRAVILCTGSQGEPLSALSRMANGIHKTIKIEAGDSVIISATPVPGNEKAVGEVINALSKCGVKVYDKTHYQIHVSGHAGPEELKLMMALCKPRSFIPVHGEAVHLMAHAKLAAEVGIDPENIYVCENGDVIELTPRGTKRNGSVESGVVFVDGLSVGDTSESVLNERNDLCDGGIAVVSAAVNLRKKSIVGKVNVDLRGVSGGDEQFLIDDLKRSVASSINKGLKKGARNDDLKKNAKDSVLSILWSKTKQRPMIIVNIIKVEM